jgi:phage shock protein PspC (stress-responsive transcriptional regulator)
MSTPYPPQPRRLMRDPSKKLIGGVCSGLAKYLNMDVNLVRILAVVITLFTGIPIVLYLIALFVLPEEETTPPQPPYVNGPQPGAYDAGFPGQGHQAPYGAPAQPPVDQVWGPAGAPWEQPQTVSPPAAPTAAPSPQAWTQPSAPEPTVVEPVSPEPTVSESTGTEATDYDTAPATPGQAPTGQAPTDPESDEKKL